MERKVKHRGSRFLGALLGMVLVFGLTACGVKETAQVQEEEKYVYVPQYMELPSGGEYYEARVFGDNLYYTEYSYDEETEESTMAVCKLNLQNASVEKTQLQLESMDSLNKCVVTEDGSIYGVIYSWQLEDASSPYAGRSSQKLCKFGPSGERIAATDLSEFIGEESYISNLLVDESGRCYVLTDTDIYLVEADGTYVGTVSVGNANGGWINSAVIADNNKAYVSTPTGSGGNQLLEIDFDKRAIGEKYDGFPAGYSAAGLCSGQEGCLLINDGSMVSEYNLVSREKRELFQWLDCDINGQNVTSLGHLADGRIAVVVNDWTTGKSELAVLEEKPASEVAKKEVIVIGALYENSELQSAAVAFNKDNEKYRINIKTYMDHSLGEEAWNDAITKLNNEITSGNAPDIVSLNGLDAERLVAKGVFEDLGTYLDNSSKIHRMDFVSGVLESFMVVDQLIGIPKSFNIQTLIGGARELGTEMGWTIDEMIAYADAHPKANLFDYASKNSALSYCLMYNMDYFVDWSEGICRFHTPEFIHLLEFVNRFPEEPDYEDNTSTPSKIQNGEVLLQNAYLYNFEEVQMYEEIFSGDYNFIGYPTADGSAGCALACSDLYAIVSKSEHKEGAWAFIEHYLSDAPDAEAYHNYFGFPTTQKQLDAMVEDATRVETFTWVDENGVEHEETDGSRGTVSYEDGWTYTYRTTTMEDVNRVLELIKVAKPMPSGNNDIMTIIFEEAGAYFEGGKSAEEAAEIIQRRVQIYVDENQ